jgi:hypothetical protein
MSFWDFFPAVSFLLGLALGALWWGLLTYSRRIRPLILSRDSYQAMYREEWPKRVALQRELAALKATSEPASPTIPSSSTLPDVRALFDSMTDGDWSSLLRLLTAGSSRSTTRGKPPPQGSETTSTRSKATRISRSGSTKRKARRPGRQAPGADKIAK